MKINPKYGEKIISIPAVQVLEHLKEASGDQLKVIIFALSKLNTSLQEIAEATGLSEATVYDALSLWKKKGVISVTGLGKKPSAANGEKAPEPTEKVRAEAPDAEDTANEKKSPRVVLMSSELPSYSSDRINRILEKNKGTKSLIDNCQQILGKIMSIHEVEVILKLMDYLDLDADFILLLCTHCASINKTSLRYIEKTALSLFDSGITEYESLEKYVESYAVARSREGKIRKLLGIGDRSLTKKERDIFVKWAIWGMPMNVIEKAFEITAENTKRFSLNYMNTVLERWYKEGLCTLKKVEASLESYKESKKKNTGDGGSFATEDFFEAALLRSYNTDNDNKATDNS